jgi:hypothetical protein
LCMRVASVLGYNGGGDMYVAADVRWK